MMQSRDMVFKLLRLTKQRRGREKVFSMSVVSSDGPCRTIGFPKSENARRLSLTLASLAFTLLLFEIPALLKIVNYQKILGPTSPWKRTLVDDPELLAIHHPDSHYTGSMRGNEFTAMNQIPERDTTEYRWDLQYDHHGFRNDHDLKSADIAVIGDSFIEGMTVANPQIMTSLLANLQGKVVANLGHGSYGPQQELIVLKRYGLPLRPRSVVWMFFEGNDLQDAVFYRSAMKLRASFWRDFIGRSFTMNASGELRHVFGARKAPGVRRAGVFRTSDGTPLTTYFIYRATPLDRDSLRALDITADTLETARRLCAAQGSRFIVVFIPTAFRALHKFCEFPPESECRNWVVNDLPDRLRTAVESDSSGHPVSEDAGSAAAGYLDLTPYFERAAASGLLPYYRDDPHWSEVGHRIAAEALNAYLSGTGNH
jgi:hypothetical protein